MQIILLSGGSGSRLWPLSNGARSKQFLRLLEAADGGERESMVQRIVRQIRKSGIDAPIAVATSVAQRDAVLSQLGESVDIVTEPSRRQTFPAICLACEYLKSVKGCSDDEPVVVLPCDQFTDSGYYSAIKEMIDALEKNVAPLILMGIRPTYPSAKYGYIVPGEEEGKVRRVDYFVEKPSASEAERLILKGAMWNGGVFAFRLGFVTRIAEKFGDNFDCLRENFDSLPAISFDNQIVANTSDSAMVSYGGAWKDLGTWLTLTDEIGTTEFGNVLTDGTAENTHIFNELNIPLLCIGTKNLVVAASPDGIIVTEKEKSENIKDFAPQLLNRPMIEERRWGTYRVIDTTEFPDGFCALTKQLTLQPGCSISYQRHFCREELWTFIDGEGEIVIDGERRKVKRGDTVVIPKEVKHALKATTRLTFIEVQSGHNLVEEDIERFPFEW